MMEFDHPRTAHIQISGIRQFADLVSQYPDALSLTIGQPHFPTPAHIGDAAAAAIRAGHTTYTSNRGLPELRRAAQHYYQRLAGLAYDAESEILVTVGATHALDISLRALLQPDDEVLIPAPTYPGYEPIVWLCGAQPVYIDTRQSDFKLTPEQLQKALTPRTRALILAAPANPTGVTYTEAELAELAKVLERSKVFVIADEIYSELRFDGAHVSIANCAGMRERTIVIQGLSKSHSMTGWRIGFTLAPAGLTNELVKVLQYSVSCASSISQYAALEALSRGAGDSVPMREQYRQNRNQTIAALRQMGLPVTEPQGAFYAFPQISGLGLAAKEFAARMLQEQRVAVVPGDAFSPLGEGYVRLSFACEPSHLAEGLRRMARFVEDIRTRL